VPHYDDPSNTVTMEAGMTFTIEPMLTLGVISYDSGPTAGPRDERTTSAPRSSSNTILVTEDGHEILTLP